MTLPALLISAGVALTILGLIGLGICIAKALAVRRSKDTKAGQVTLQSLAALNMASVGIAFLGLAAVIVGLIF